MKRYIILIVIFFFNSLTFCQSNTDWSDPKNIDPMNIRIGDFLDIQTENYILSATVLEAEGNYLEAARYYLFLLRYDYRNAEYIYKLARCYGFMNEYELASIYLAKAVNAGYNDFEYIKIDKAFSGIRRTQIFKETIEKLDNYSKSFGENLYIEGSSMLNCKVKFPDSYDSAQAYSLVIALHGNGGNSDSYAQVADFFTTNNFIFATPQGPYLKAQSNGKLEAEYSWEIQIADNDVWKKGVCLSKNYIMNVVDYFKSNYKIKNVYLFGFSQGAAYTYIIGIKHYDRFNGIIALSGRLLPINETYSVMTEEEILKAKDMNVFIGHGTNDKIIEFEQAKSAKSRLKKAGYDVTFYSYEEGHNITIPLIQEVVKWIISLENK